jgi:hypothetical protein
MQVRVGYDPRSCTYQGISFPKKYTTDMEAACWRSKLNVQQQQQQHNNNMYSNILLLIELPL